MTVAPPPPPAAPDSGPCAGGDHCPGARGAVSTASTARGARARPRAVRGSVGSVAGRGANLCPRSGQCPGCCRRTHLIPVSGCGRGRDPGRRAGRSPSRRGRAWGRSVPATTPRSAARPAGLRGRRSYSDLRPVRQGLPGAFCAPSTVARSCLRAVARPVAARRPIVYRRARSSSQWPVLPEEAAQWRAQAGDWLIPTGGDTLAAMTEKLECAVIRRGRGRPGHRAQAGTCSAGKSFSSRRKRQPAQHTSSRNSEVMHAGIHYRPGSLKARLCVRGRRLMTEYCIARGMLGRPSARLWSRPRRGRWSTRAYQGPAEANGVEGQPGCRHPRPGAANRR